MNLIELQRSLRQLRLGGMAAVLETRLRQAQAEPMTLLDLISCLVSDELKRRADRLLERGRKLAGFRDPDRTLDKSTSVSIRKSIAVWCSIWPPAASSANAKTRCFSDPVAPARVTWRKPSAKPRFCKATRCCIAKPTCCSMSWPKPSPKIGAVTTSNRSPLCRREHGLAVPGVWDLAQDRV